MRKPGRTFNFAGWWLLAAMCLSPWAIAQTAAESQRDGYQYFEIGDIAASRPGSTEAGLMLVGGGDWPYEAFGWMIEKAGHGRIVILRASGTTNAQEEFFRDIGGISAAQTIVFQDRRAASDPEVLRIVREADGIFLAGGDQSNYVRFWKGTPLNQLLDAHVRAGKPIGGTSAGLAILGGFAYGAMDGGSVVSADAMANPMSSEVTLIDDFLHMPHLGNVITDSHFGERNRLGRLIAFIARLSHEQQRTDLVGIGIDEYTALCIDAHGNGRVFSGDGGHAWLVRPQRHADQFAEGKPLTFRRVPVIGLGAGSTIRFPDLQVQSPAFERHVDVVEGRFTEPQPTASLE